jgi:hypothetical protein
MRRPTLLSIVPSELRVFSTICKIYRSFMMDSNANNLRVLIVGAGEHSDSPGSVCRHLTQRNRFRRPPHRSGAEEGKLALC